ncbi:hypothetical protein AWC38_SpisGene22871 [Stylophora pistillata]|uniref:Uncharacterized protein n=1 Tax=Stylophora pistillata TaxID=50429 RepID=A0A2B4R9L0_STYPI|nr:hypothetical protein AWC38_SpisGene22871 [Stylophora pistillata]
MTRDYEIIVERMREQLKPERSALVARYQFDNRARNSVLAIEQANKDVKVLQGEQGPGTPINKLDTVKTGEEQAISKPPPEAEGFRGNSMGSFKKQIRIPLHFFALSFIQSLELQEATVLRLVWMVELLFFTSPSDNVTSSTYLQVQDSVFEIFKWLIITRYNTGPEFVPWRTPADIGSQSEIEPANLTRCRREVKEAKAEMSSRWIEIHLDRPLLRLETSDTIPTLEDVLSKHGGVFSEGLGKMKNIQARIQVKEDARPRFWKARAVAPTRKPAVDEALRELEAEGVIKKIATSEWAAPVVTPVKKDGSLEEAFADRPGYERVLSISVRCGSIISDLAQKLNSTTKQQDVIPTLLSVVIIIKMML